VSARRLIHPTLCEALDGELDVLLFEPGEGLAQNIVGRLGNASGRNYLHMVHKARPGRIRINEQLVPAWRSVDTVGRGIVSHVEPDFLDVSARGRRQAYGNHPAKVSETDLLGLIFIFELIYRAVCSTNHFK